MSAMKNAVPARVPERGSRLRGSRIPPRPQGAVPRDGRDADGVRFSLNHFWIPLVLLVLATDALMVRHGDLWFADRLYAWEGYRWAARHSVLAERILHRGGHDLSVLAWLGVLGAWAVARSRDALAHWRRPLGYLLLAVALSTLAVAWVKAWSNMDCPWDVLRYGGSRPFVDLLTPRPPGLARGHCFPAGHASAGYAWMSLYFFLLLARPRWRFAGLLVGAGLGLLFGIDQQLRGAHFLSHDLWSAGICWMVALGLYLHFCTDSAPTAGNGARKP